MVVKPSVRPRVGSSDSRRCSDSSSSSVACITLVGKAASPVWDVGVGGSKLPIEVGAAGDPCHHALHLLGQRIEYWPGLADGIRDIDVGSIEQIERRINLVGSKVVNPSGD